MENTKALIEYEIIEGKEYYEGFYVNSDNYNLYIVNIPNSFTPIGIESSTLFLNINKNENFTEKDLLKRIKKKYNIKNKDLILIQIEQSNINTDNVNNKKYSREAIENLDPRQCVYVDFNEGATNLVINGKNAIEQKQENYSPEITENELKVIKQFPNYEAYRWFNKRGVCVIFRTEKNESMFDWNDLLKLC